MKKMLTAMSALCASVLFAAVPVIDQASVTVEQRGNRTVVISYDLNAAAEGDAEPAIITVDILTNAVGEAAASVGGEHLWTLSGDVNKIVQQGKRKILWSPHKEGMGEWTLPALQVQAVVTAWATNAPPAYWVIDLTTPSSRTADRYYPNAEQIPLTVTNIIYKTDRLVFRHIPACGVTWKMGSPEDEEKRSTSGTETQHYVTFSHDYWMAVFETTRGQHYRIQPDQSSNAKISTEGSALPSVGYQYNGLRNLNRSDAEPKVNWPSNLHEVVGSNSIIKQWRDALGGLMVDLPTSAEWEYACRAGTATAYSFGATYSGYGDYVWSKDNASAGKEVGLKLPNPWGLYDMHGNVQEWCLDWYTYPIASTPVWDPVGPYADDVNPDLASDYYGRYQRILRGGSYNNYIYQGHFRSARHGCFPLALAVDYDGYRLCLVIP